MSSSSSPSPQSSSVGSPGLGVLHEPLVAPVKKRRIQRACDACRVKRTACNGLRTDNRQCSSCVEEGILCVYSGASTSTPLTKEKHRTPSQSVDEHGPSPGPGVETATLSIRAVDSPSTEDTSDYAEMVRQMTELRVSEPHLSRFLGKSSPWTTASRPKPTYVFPPQDLLYSLITLYFEHANLFLPLLHRPSFERDVSRGSHLLDDQLGAIVLLVCAIGSRFSHDPRVHNESTPLNSGRMFSDQVDLDLDVMTRKETMNLLDLQRFCLAIEYNECASRQMNWALVGIGIRAAVELGLHRRQDERRHTVASELYRRAFWVLVYYDRLLSCTLGRPSALQGEDFDVQLPTECDDEYWEQDGVPLFQQPPGKPSAVSYFTSTIKLTSVLAFSLKLLYALDKTKAIYSVRDPAWEEHLVVELDSALNKWFSLLPDHLRWNPHGASEAFFRQSVALHCHYHFVQMITHRPFLPILRMDPPTNLPSLAICTNAARACVRVADAWLNRCPESPIVYIINPLCMAAIMLIITTISNRSTVADASRAGVDIPEVDRVSRIIATMETRWQLAGLLRDTLAELISARNDLPADHASCALSESLSSWDGMFQHQHWSASTVLSPSPSHSYPCLNGTATPPISGMGVGLSHRSAGEEIWPNQRDHESSHPQNAGWSDLEAYIAYMNGVTLVHCLANGIPYRFLTPSPVARSLSFLSLSLPSFLAPVATSLLSLSLFTLGLASVAVATVLLAIVALDVPYFKSVYFLRIDLGNGTVTASAAANQTNAFVDLGVLGFCTDLRDGRGLQCSSPQIGYSLSSASKFINGTLPPALTSRVNAVASSLTKVLVLHVAAFGIALVSFAFALLSFFGAPIADCCSSCFCGFASAAAFAVFVFDIAFFELVKKRVQAEANAGAAVLGNALYLTLFAWLLLMITPILFLIGRCFGCCMPDISDKRHKY
ncbi:unnamed protein product [Mycena citricolor]|uniref:Zn(2)-C6 fungal-type domain-containing protein n=1 Tax=Mycena citricolor TaxID=2018698 RepID=A0AAD2Q2W5_9AGAR|nr:unnamed protein product [Mycena citricolor]